MPSPGWPRLGGPAARRLLLGISGLVGASFWHSGLGWGA